MPSLTNFTTITTTKCLLQQTRMGALAQGPGRIGQAHFQSLYPPQAASPFLERAVWLV